MSEHENHDDEILERNLERLLGSEQQRAEVPPEARARMLGKLRDGGPQPQVVRAANDGGTRRRITVSVLVAIAAAVILAWVLGLGDRLIGAPEDEQQIASYEHRELGAKLFMLADGSRAILRTGTILQELAPRHLRLVAGEVLLDVGEAVEPMLVETPEGRALVLGTRLLLRSDGVQTLAAVFHGQAKLESQADDASPLFLRAGEQALLRETEAPARIAGRRLSFEIDWARELLAPEQTPEPVRRGNLIARVPRWTGQLGPSPEWPLPMRELIVDVHVEDGHVRTTIDQTFFNHLDRDLEGVYKFPLPPKAAIARLAMYVDGQRMEAGVVERDRGRDIYEQIVHRRRDPALLEWMQGNLFQVRIFPLPGRTEKRILLSYTAALDELYGEGELRVPIPEIDLPVGKVKYRIRVVGAAGREFSSGSHEFVIGRDGDDLLAEWDASNHAIGADIVATLAVGATGVKDSVEHHRMVDAAGRRHHGVRLRPDLQAELAALGAGQTRLPARDWVVLFDTSASRGAAELEAQRQFLHELTGSLDGGDRLAVALFDSRVRWSDVELRSVADIDLAALDQLVARESRIGLGLTDLGLAIDEALARLQSASAPSDDERERIATLLYLGDGLAQDLDGPTDAALHVDALAQRFAGRAEFVAASFGQAYDQPGLDRLAAAGAGHYVHVAEGDAIAWRALELLTTLATSRVLELEAELVDAQGQVIARESTHASARSLADGEALEVLARLDADAPEPVAIELRGVAQLGEETAWTRRIELPIADDGARWLPRAWARSQVAALSEAGVEENAAAITELGLAHFLVTPTTSLLVLESEAMYRNFAVHRPAEETWAHYGAPDRIEVIREGVRSEAGLGQYVTRSPVAILDANVGRTSVRTRGFGPMASGPSDMIGLGNLGLIGSGRGGGGRETGFGFGLGSSGIIGRVGGSGSSAGFGGRGARRDLGEPRQASRNQGGGEFSGFVSRQSNTTTWSSSLQTGLAQPLAGSAAVDAPFASTIVSGASLHAEMLGGLWPGAMPWPVGLHYSSDWRLNDLGELVPALFEEPFDLAREELLITGLEGERGSISEAAAELIGKARAAQGNVRYSLPEGGTLDIDADGRFALAHERWGFLQELVVYDTDLSAHYPELGISVVREVGPTSPALLGAWVPWMVPEADHLAHFYDVALTGPRTLKLTLIGDQDDEQPWLEVELDAEHRVIAMRMRIGEQTRSTTEFVWTETGVELEGGRTLTRVGAAQPFGVPTEATRVNLPLPSPADLELELDELTVGDDAWINVQQQRLAGAAALNQLDQARTILAALAQHAGRVLPGELVLGGASLYQSAPELRDAVLDASLDGPVQDYVRAGLQATGNRIAALRKLADDDDLVGSPTGFWASYRTLLHESEHGPGESSLVRLERFLSAYQHPTFAYVATLQLNNRWWSNSRKAKAWLALAEQDNQWKHIALHQAGLAHYYRGDHEDAAELFQRAMNVAELDECMPVVDWSVQWAITYGFGDAAWQLAWSRLRERVGKADDPRLAMRFMVAAQQLGRPEDGQRVLDRLEPADMDASVGVVVFDMLVSQGHMSEARAVLDAVLERGEQSPEVLLRMAEFAERQGDLDKAAQTLEQALLITLDQRGLTLDELRAGFEGLFDLRARQARPIATNAATVDDAIARALAVADRWRHEDPDNPAIDLLCAELLWSHERDDEAWRQLSSVIDRHAAEGAALAWLADALERAGQLERAQKVWARTIAVEPTDVHNRVRQATNLLANQHEVEAKAALKEIVDGEWQPRFAGDVVQARKLLRKLEE